MSRGKAVMLIRILDDDATLVCHLTSSLILASAPLLISARISAKSPLEDDAFSLVAETISCRAVRPIYADIHTDRQMCRQNSGRHRSPIYKYSVTLNILQKLQQDSIIFRTFNDVCMIFFRKMDLYYVKLTSNFVFNC